MDIPSESIKKLKQKLTNRWFGVIKMKLEELPSNFSRCRTGKLDNM